MHLPIRTGFPIAIALATFFPQLANALAPNVVPDVVINTVGQASQSAVLGAFLSSACNGDMHIYKDSTGTKIGENWVAYYCTLTSVSDVPASLQGRKVLFNHRIKGGNHWGVIPVGKGTNVEFMNIRYGNGTHCSLASGGQVYTCTWEDLRSSAVTAIGNGTIECPLNSSNYSSGNRKTMCVIPDAGVTAFEPGLLVGSNLPTTWTPLTNSEIASLTFKTQLGLIYGIAVTDDVYSALQVQQNTSDIPSLSRDEISAIFKGYIKGWKKLDPDLTNISSVPNTGLLALCRGATGSGTQVVQTAHFLNSPCSAGFSNTSDMVGPGSSSTTYRVVNNETIANESECLNRAYNGGLFPANTSLKYGAVGFFPIDKQPTFSDRWKYVAIDGIEPTVDNAIKGKYNNVYEQTMQWRASTTGVKLDALNMILTVSRKPEVINQAGLVGAVALPEHSDWKNAANYPTSRSSRDGNSCSSSNVRGY